MPIQILPEQVIAQIAAGEVVERPASVVKELLENALDAGAKNLHIEIIAGGQKRIRISDDGDGIDADEVRLSITRHATSKLRSADDLPHIQTLGFRGEALASIAAVSQMTLVTRHREAEIGSQIRVVGGIVEHEKSVGAPAGTVITVENLFYNTPARLKFLKSENTEKRHIVSIITHYAMAYPHVRFVLLQDGREVFRSPGSGHLADVVVKVFGLEHFKEMIEVRGEEQIRESGDFVHVQGFASQPSLHRKDRTRIILFVNGRAVQDSGLIYAVTQAYHTLIEKGRHPFAVLMIDVPSEFVDVNVHPTKSEVRFQDTNVVFSAVQRTVRQAVIGYAQAKRHRDYRSYQQAESGWALPYDKKQQMDMDFVFENDNQLPATAYDDVDYDPTAIPEGPGRPARPRTLPLLRVVGQIGAAYIVAEGPAGMYLIDQHAAHMRVLYEELQEIYKQQERIPHRELQSQTIDLSTRDSKLLESHLDLLGELGFLLEPFGSSTFMIRGIPAILQSGDPAEAVWQIVELLDDHPGDGLQDYVIQTLASMAALKSGQILNLEELRALVHKLERCPNPHTSPDGRATLIHMSAEQLARQFGRAQ